MKRARYWMWASSKSILESSSALPADSSWEEEAFAEDTAGPFGGFIWPPRSYSCSFCGRKFMSAQALGGHMNVHRRERAKLKQSPISHSPSSNSAASSRSLNILESKIEEAYTKKQSNIVEPYDWPISLSLSVGLGRSETDCSKKRRTSGLSMPFFLNTTTEELDLELRLGHGQPN